MQTVVNISLNGIAYQLEEPGYLLLRTYLERAEARLKDSPDRAEVMADLEQAIGEKCARLLGTHKTVVNTAEVERIISDMGPVEAPDGAPGASTEGGPNNTGATGAAQADSPLPRKRLFKIREGAMWGGVCNGIAAYLNVDVTWVRIASVVLTLLTGITLIAYFALVFIVPYAETAEDRAAAFGMPFSTEDLITRAKKNTEFRENYRWRREWRRQQAQWNRQWQEMNAQMRMTAANAMPHMSHTARAITSVFLPIAAIIGAVVFVGWILAMFSLLTQHSIFGWGLPSGMPMWVGMLLLAFAYFAITAPLKMIRHGAHRSAGHHPGWGALHGLMWIGFTALFFWIAYHWFPGVRELVDQLMWAANLTVETISETIA